MPTLPIRKDTYVRLEKLALSKRMSPDTLLASMLDSAERHAYEMDQMLAIFSECCPNEDDMQEAAVDKSQVIYTLSFAGGNSNSNDE